jgi:type IX secretion system PorP/SprF family membrane protein
MRKIIIISAVLFFVSLLIKGSGYSAFAQQDPQYSQYMFNQMAINPAYAGSKDALSTSVFFRNQWTGIDGAPKTETVSIHGPLAKKKIGLGFTVVADQIGIKKSIGALGSFAYRIPIRNGKLAFGLRFGIYNYSYKLDDNMYKDKADVYNTQLPSLIVPTADAGLYYYTSSLYLGFSATHLYGGRLTNITNQNSDNAQLSPHYFFTFGKAWEFSDKLIFNPSCMVKTAANVPATIDVNFSFLLAQRVWLGLSTRSSYGAVVYTQIYITDKFKLGYAYDIGLNKIGRAGGGTHELMIGYDFNVLKSKMISPRYL